MEKPVDGVRVFPGLGKVGVTAIKGTAVVEEPPEELKATGVEPARGVDQKLVHFPPSASLASKLSGGETGFNKVLDSIPSVRVPTEIWVADWKRNPGVFNLNPDPMQRLLAVNASSPKGGTEESIFFPCVCVCVRFGV